MERLPLFKFEVYHRPGVDADFLSRLDNLREANASEEADAEPLETMYPLLFPLNKMYEEFDANKLMAGTCAAIQPTNSGPGAGQVSIVDQPCGRGGCCDACFLGAMVEGYQIAMITPPAGTMGELPDMPPIIYPDNSICHVNELAKGQKKDPITSWFIEYVIRPVGRGNHPKVRESPDMHPEARAMLRSRTKFRLSSGAQFGN